MIDFNALIKDGWSFGFLDVEDEYKLRPKLKRREELPGVYTITLDEVGTPTFKRESANTPGAYYGTKGVHPEFGDIYIFGNPNDEGYVLVNGSIAALLGLENGQ